MKRTYSKERMTNIAAVISVIQATIYLGFVLYFLELLMNSSKAPVERHRIVLHYLIAPIKKHFLITLFLVGVVHLAWFFSSIYVLLGNRNGNERSVSQYLAVISLVNLMDIIFPFVVLPSLFTVFRISLDPQLINEDRLGEPIVIGQEDFGSYFWLLMTFIRGGGLTFLIDMFCAIMAYHRYMELHEMRVRSRVNSRFAEKGNYNYPLAFQDEPTTCVDIPLRDKIKYRLDKEVTDPPVLRPYSTEEPDMANPTFQQPPVESANSTMPHSEEENSPPASHNSEEGDSPNADETEVKTGPRVLNGIKKAEAKVDPQ